MQSNIFETVCKILETTEISKISFFENLNTAEKLILMK
jgi:hypothetical protein